MEVRILNLYVPFLIFKDSESEVSTDMELASAFLYFDLNRTESLKSIFTKQPRESISWISRGMYPLTAKLYSDEDRLYCIYDDMGVVDKNVEIRCSLDISRDKNIDNFESMEVKSKIQTIESITNDMRNADKVQTDSGYLISGYKKTEKILEGKDQDPMSMLSVDLREHKRILDTDISLIKNVISRLEQSIEGEIQLLKDLGRLDDYSFKNSITERNNIYEEFKDKIYQTDKKVSSNIARLIIEREDKIRDVDKIYSDKAAYLTQDYILNKNKYDIAQIYGNEIEMDIYKKSMSDAEERIEQLKKEAGEEIKKMESHYDKLIDGEKEKIKQAIDDRSKKVKECEEMYGKLHSAIDELKKAVSEDIFGRRNQIEEIKSWFGKFNCIKECETITINIPFYIAEYVGEDVRYKIFYPGVLKEKNQIMALISGIAGKVPLPFSEREKLFEYIFEKFKEILRQEENSHILNVFVDNNLMNNPGMNEKVESGLKELFNTGYLNDKNHEKALTSIKSMFNPE